jgi:hypothetical protein
VPSLLGRDAAATAAVLEQCQHTASQSQRFTPSWAQHQPPLQPPMELPLQRQRWKGGKGEAAASPPAANLQSSTQGLGAASTESILPTILRPLQAKQSEAERQLTLSTFGSSGELIAQQQRRSQTQ